jgi:serine/threonine-protein kinase RsbW
MFAATVLEHDIEVQMSSELRHVDRSVELLREFLVRHGAENRFFDVALVTREALNNAILHGNGADPAKEVLWRLKHRQGKLRLYVKDQGHGFDWQAWLRRSSDPEAESGRGHEIFRLLTTRFSHNRCGNALCVEIPLKS